MFRIFATLLVGLAAAGPWLLRRAGRDSSAGAPIEDSGTPMPERWRWLVRGGVALFAGFVVAGLVNELLGSVARWLGHEIELDSAGQAVALWPPTPWGQAAEVLFFATLALAAVARIDRRFLLTAGPGPAAAVEAVAVPAAAVPPAAAPAGPESPTAASGRAGGRRRGRPRPTRR